MNRSRQPRQIWHAPSGSPKGPRWTIEQFLDQAYPAANWLYKQRPRYRTKARFVKRAEMSLPTLRKYQEYGALPWPLPPEDHLVFVVDGETRKLRWVSPKLCEILGRDCKELVNRDAWATLHPDQDIPKIAPQYTALWCGIQREPLENNTARQVQIDTRIRRHDGIWLAVRLTVSYGSVFQTWFVDAEVTAVLEDAEDSGDSIFNVDQSRIFHQMPRLTVADIRNIEDLLRAPRPVQIEYYDEILKRFPYRYRGDESPAS